jgi:hypothetical protein
MDCGVWTCLKFAVWTKAVSLGHLYEYTNALDYPTVEFHFSSAAMSAAEWGKLGREHILKSLCDGYIDFDARVLQELKVRVRLPSIQ